MFENANATARFLRAGKPRIDWCRCQIASAVWRAASIADPVASSWRGIIAVSAAIGIIPVLLALCGLATLHQPIAALLLAPVVWSCARRGDWRRGMGVLALTFAWHSSAIIWFAYLNPEGASAVVPDGTWYWDKQRTWITTGQDPEYDVRNWAIAHVQLLGAATLFSFTSLGTITLHQGLYEVDLMNYYNAQLLHHSQNGWLAMLLGWHIWSILRGIGYVVLTFELVSLAIQFFSGRATSTWHSRRRRWAIGGLCLLADATTKWLLLEAVRVRLFDNLL